MSAAAARSYRTGSKHVHTVTDWHGAVVGERRSAHSYAYAICRRVLHADGPTIAVDRWSNSPKCSGAHFTIQVQHAVPLSTLAPGDWFTVATGYLAPGGNADAGMLRVAGPSREMGRIDTTDGRALHTVTPVYRQETAS